MRIPFLILAITFLFACGKADKKAPSIYVTAPTVNNQYYINDTVFYDLTFVDNKELEMYQLLITHADTFVIENKFGNLLPPFNRSINKSINSNTVFISDHVIIDQPVAAGNYQVLVLAADKEGNASTKSLQFQIKNQQDTIAPLIDSLLVPAENTAVPVAFSAQVRDDQQLAVLQYVVVRQSTSDTVIYRDYNLNGSTFNFNDTFTVSNGSYRLKLKVRDVINNQSEREATFIVQ